MLQKHNYPLLAQVKFSKILKKREKKSHVSQCSIPDVYQRLYFTIHVAFESIDSCFLSFFFFLKKLNDDTYFLMHFASSVPKGCKQGFEIRGITTPVQAKYLRTYFYGAKHHQPKTMFDYQLQLCLLHDMVPISHKPRLTPFRH